MVDVSDKAGTQRSACESRVYRARDLSFCSRLEFPKRPIIDTAIIAATGGQKASELIHSAILWPQNQSN